MKKIDSVCRNLCENCKNYKEILGGGSLCSVSMERVETRTVRKCEAYRHKAEKLQKKL